mgnify:CR=1 FL=1
MQLRSKAIKSESNGTLATQELGVGEARKVFHLLTEGLYKDPIGSIIRELVSNAVDSHTDASTDRAIDVQLPSDFDPQFSVRDYGVSMSPEQIDAVYRNLTASTKDDRDDVIGAFGIGSKTPLAYTDSFSITTFLDGVKRSYSVYMEQGDIPSIDLMFEGKTDEDNGVLVSVPVLSSDIYVWRRSANSQLAFMTADLNVYSNGSAFEFQKFEGARTVGDVEIGGHPSLPSGFYVVQGGVGYRLDNNFTDNLTDADEDVREFMDTVHDIAALRFNIGEIDVASTRENIKYTKRTLNNIRDKIASAVEEVKKSLDSGQFDFGDAELHAEEWCSMYIDGPDVGASWDRFELEQDEAEIQAKGLDESGNLELKVSVGPVKGSVLISKEMWKAIGEKFENE